jgi:hypothetical protein
MLPTTTAPVKPVLLITRIFFAVAAFLAGIAGIQLYILAEHTDQYFAWTIANPLSAAFIGAGFWTGTVLLLMSVPERAWANIRIALAAVGPFVPLMLVITLLHVDRFHLRSSDLNAQIAAWAWLIVYIAVPFAVVGIVAAQLLAPGGDPQKDAAVPLWMRVLTGINALAALVVGLALLLFPEQLFSLWPWALTALTGRAIGVGFIAVGCASMQFIRDNSWSRSRVGALPYLLMGLLQLLSLLRFAGQVEWGRPGTWLYLLFMLGVVGGGLYSAFMTWMPFAPRAARSVATS